MLAVRPRMLTLAVAAVVALLTMFAVVSAAGAAGYDTSGTLTLSKSTVAPGESLTASGSGYAAGASVTLELHSAVVSLGTVAADSTGNFSKQVTVPSDATLGAHTVKSLGLAPNGGTLTLSSPLTVASSGITNKPTGPLAFTGAGWVIPLAGLGLAAVGVGVVLQRRRQTA